MIRTIRRTRAAVVLAVLWGVGLGAVGLGAGLAGAVWSGHEPILADVARWWGGWHRPILSAGVGLAAFGALVGLSFAAALGAAERGRRTHTLSGARTALWGGAAGAVVYLVAFVLPAARPVARASWALVAYPLVPVLLFAALGALCAWGTLALARRPAAGSGAGRDADIRGRPAAVGGGAPLGSPDTRRRARVV